MTPDAVTVVATSLLALGSDEERIPAILNSNIPAVGGGEITKFTLDHVKEIMAYAKLTHPEWYQGLKEWDEEDENIQSAVEFLKFGGIKHGRVIFSEVGMDHASLKSIARQIIMAGSTYDWCGRVPDRDEIPIGAETTAPYGRVAVRRIRAQRRRDLAAAPPLALRSYGQPRVHVWAGCYEVSQGRGQYAHYHSGEGPKWAPGGLFGPGGKYPPPPGYGSNDGVCGGSLSPTGPRFVL